MICYSVANIVDTNKPLVLGSFYKEKEAEKYMAKHFFETLEICYDRSVPEEVQEQAIENRYFEIVEASIIAVLDIDNSYATIDEKFTMYEELWTITENEIM